MILTVLCDLFDEVTNSTYVSRLKRKGRALFTVLVFSQSPTDRSWFCEDSADNNNFTPHFYKTREKPSKNNNHLNQYWLSEVASCLTCSIAIRY